MSVYDVPNTNPKRRPSLRGGVVLDVVRGAERVRAWPGKRTKAQNEAQKERNDHFRSVQWATKYLEPSMMIDIMEAREGMPLLPRDVATMLLYNTLAWVMDVSGKRWYPEMARNQVSESLDAISQSQGYILIRGEEYWEAVPYVPPVNALLLFNEQVLIAPAASIIVDNIPAQALDIILQVEGRNTSTQTTMRMRMNNDTGNNYNFRRESLYGSVTAYPGSFIEIGEATVNAADANLFSMADVTISNYARTDRWKRVQACCALEGNASVAQILTQQSSATWKNTAPITRIDIFAGLGNLSAGSMVRTWLRGSV